MAASMNASFGIRFVGLGLIFFVLLVDTTRLVPEEILLNRVRKEVAVPRSSMRNVKIFCYEGVGPSKSFAKKCLRAFSSAIFRINISSQDFKVFRGPNGTDVYSQYEESTGWLYFFPWRADSVTLPLFDKTCIGVDAKERYIVKLHVTLIDFWLLLFLAAGLVLFFSAQHLSRNLVFYYGTGVSIGVLASILVVAFLLSRLIPRRIGAYAVIFGGFTVSMSIVQYMYQHLQDVVEKHLQAVLIYFVVVGLVSFAVCYRYGPVTDTRTLNLIKWALQLLGLLLVFCSMQPPQLAMAVICLLLLLYNFPVSINIQIVKYWRRKFPKRIRPLTEDQYVQQGIEETRKALEDLRNYCRSPDCNTWKTVGRIRTPIRFAKFIEGDSHITDDEYLEYDSDPSPPLPHDSDSETEIDFRLNSS